MKYKVFIKIISLFLAILFVCSTASVFVFAAETEVPTFENIEESNVVDDLERMGIDITKYQKDVDAEHCRMLYFLEYGYDYKGSNTDYGLYVYMWNPTGKQINTTTGMNSIEMQVSLTSNVDKDGLGFLKYKLELCNYSTVQGYEYVFYKFKIADAKNFIRSVNRDLRVYDISGVELHHTGNAKPTDYNVGGIYSFSGFMPYHSSTQSVRNTLKVNVTDRLTIDLKLTPVSWKSEQSEKGGNYQYEMFSLYFSVPNDIIDDYGNPENEEHKGLVAIDGQYSKHKINGIVTNDDEVYDVSLESIGVDVSNIFENDVRLNFAVDAYEGSVGDLNRAYKTYNRSGIDYLPEEYLSWLCTALNYSLEEFEEIAQAELSEQLNSIWEKSGFYCTCDICNSSTGYGPFIDSDCGDDLFYTIEAGEDLTDKISNYAASHTWWEALWSGNLGIYNKPQNYEGAMSIQAVDTGDLIIDGIFKTDEAISKEYFMMESEVNTFTDFVEDEALKGRTTYLMRFAVEDYYCSEALVEIDGSTYNDGEYYFEKTIFKDIDIFTFTFENKYSQQVIIPVVASPVDNVGSITPPNVSGSVFDNIFKDNDGDWSFIAKLLAFIAGILIFAVVVFLISKLFGLPATWLFTNVSKAIVWVLSLPFKLLSWIFGSVKTLGGAPLEKDKKPSNKDEEKKE